MTEIYVFHHDQAPQRITRSESPELIVHRINQGDWEPYFGYSPEPRQAWQATRFGKHVVVAEPEPNIEFPDLQLTPRELQALQCLAAGLNQGQAAFQMHIDVRTLRGYCTRLRAKLKCRTMMQAIALAAAIGLVKPDLDLLFD